VLDRQRQAHLARMGEMRAVRQSGDVLAQLDADFEMYHLGARAVYQTLSPPWLVPAVPRPAGRRGAYRGQAGSASASHGTTTSTVGRVSTPAAAL
jgi:hypothetical protein